MDLAASWERHAEAWIAWADPAHQDGFWTHTWPALAGLLPPPHGMVLDLGCGEGRGLRRLSAAGYDVVGIDRAPTLLAAAKSQDEGARVALADARRLPMRDDSVSLVLASMSLLDLDDLDRALLEARRVLRPGGSLCAAVVHPFISAFDTESLRDGEPRLAAPYLAVRRYVDVVSRDGREMTFTSMHRPLRDYMCPLFALGFSLVDLVEDGDGAMPWLLAFRADLRRPDAAEAAAP